MQNGAIDSEDSLYRPLRPQQIRLLTLLPDEGEDGQILCNLNIVSLEDEPEYDAISYVWGDFSATIPVSISGRQVHITSNLDGALRCLRTAEPRVVWADQLCINQADLDERSKQVRMMDAVYSNAAVHVWLGDADEFTGTAFNIMRDLMTGKKFEELLDLGDGIGIPPMDFVEVMWSIIIRPWFERLWVLQEHWLARTCIFH